MVSRLEIRLKSNLTDAEGSGVKRKAKDYFGIAVDEIRVIRILMIDAELTSEQREAARTSIFTNPITEESSFKPLAQDFDWLIWVGYRPGVRDTASLAFNLILNSSSTASTAVLPAVSLTPGR